MCKNISEDGIHYCGDLIRSKNKLFNFIISARSSGKTLDFKKYMLDLYYEKGLRTLYVRRNKSEIESSKMKNFFTKTQKVLHIHEDKKFLIKNNEVHEYYEDGKGNKTLLNHVAYIVDVATSRKLRSQDFLNVGCIIFEEFTLEEKPHVHYLKGEVDLFLELYNTVARENDIPVYFLGNMIHTYNPYFLYFDIIPPKTGIKIWKDFAIEVWENRKFVDFKNTSRFGKIIEGTKYHDYAVNNKSFIDQEVLIGKLPKRSRPCFKCVYNGKYYVFWFRPDGCSHVTKNGNCDVDTLYLDDKEMQDGYMKARYYVRNLKCQGYIANFKKNRVFYDSFESQEFIRIFNREIML